MLWNPIAAAKILPGVFIPAAKAAHSGEALLAVLAIIIWHFYNVHIKHLNKSMFTGYLTEEEMLEEHPLELADIKAGITGSTATKKEIQKREGVFMPIYGALAALMLVGAYFFVNMEDTALDTVVPSDDTVVYAPLTPTPLPTPLPTLTPDESAAVEVGNTWDAGISDLFQEKCGACHGPAAMGGLDLSTYEGLMAGGSSGELIESGKLIEIQNAGGHAGQFSEEELSLISEWIAVGAPQQ
jgi:mono/diheme cytochrome c family protein